MTHTATASIDLHAAPPQVYFLFFEEEIAAALRAGFKIKQIWRNYRQADPPFPGTYVTFFRYCERYGLRKRKYAKVPPVTRSDHERWVQKYRKTFRGPTE